MTKPKIKPCFHCQGMNAANRKTCQSCFASLSMKERIKLKEESLRSGDWGGKVKEHRNASRVVDSARICVKKLHELGFKPLLIMGKERRGGYTEIEVITGIGPVPDGPVRDIIKDMTTLYEYFLRNFNQLLATAAAPPDEATPAASASATFTPEEEAFDVLTFDPDLQPPPTTPPLSSPPSTTSCLSSPPLPTLSVDSPPLPTHSLSPPPPPPPLPTTPPLSSTPPPALPLPFSPPSDPPLSCCPPVSGPTRMKKGKRKRNEHTGCKKHTWQKIFFSEKIIERRSNNGKEEVRVHWKSCSACGKEWEDTWEPAVNFSV